MRGRVLIVVVWIALGIPVALLLAFLGVPLEFAVAWILVFAAALLIARQNFLDESGPWPPAPPDIPRRGSDVSRLAWSIDSRTGAVGPSLRQRITAIADRRLRAYGVRLDTAEASAVDAVLGPGAHAALTGPVLRRAELERLLQALEHDPVPSTLERP